MNQTSTLVAGPYHGHGVGQVGGSATLPTGQAVGGIATEPNLGSLAPSAGVPPVQPAGGLPIAAQIQAALQGQAQAQAQLQGQAHLQLQQQIQQAQLQQALNNQLTHGVMPNAQQQLLSHSMPQPQGVIPQETLAAQHIGHIQSGPSVFPVQPTHAVPATLNPLSHPAMPGQTNVPTQAHTGIPVPSTVSQPPYPSQQVPKNHTAS